MSVYEFSFFFFVNGFTGGFSVLSFFLFFIFSVFVLL